MKYFVTGGTGFLGSRLVRQLLKEGHQVIALVRSSTNSQELASLGVQLRVGDITDRASVRESMLGADGVFHVAGWYKLGSREREQAHRINVDGTCNVLETMRDLKIPRGVYTSTLAVFSDTRGQKVDETYYYDGPHLTEYDRSKWRAHYQVALPLMRSGLPLIIVQPGGIFGPGDRSLLHQAFVQLLQGRLYFVPRLTAYCWAHVDDVARGHILAMERGIPGESYIICGPSYLLSEVIDLAADIADVPPPRWRVPPQFLRLLARLLQPVSAVFALPPSFHPESLRASSGVTYLGDDAKARREIGFTTRPLHEGLRETLQQEPK